jgi:hypothetical protein
MRRQLQETAMAFGSAPGVEGGLNRAHLHLRPWPLNPGSEGERPGPLGRSGYTQLVHETLMLHSLFGPARTPEGHSRPMRQGEALMAGTLFKTSVNYNRVRVHNDEFLPFGLQPNNTAMTPNGEMYFNPSRFKEDFSLAEPSDQHWFMHEMVHIWQYQLGYPVMARGAIRIGLEYEYELDPAKKLSDYNMEAQGDLLADYWALKYAGIPELVSMHVYRNRGFIGLYEQVLSRFLANPADRGNLP